MLPRLSFEIFPPKSVRAGFQLSDTLRRLAPFEPGFVSVTYGAAGGTKERTVDAIKAISDRFPFEVAGHLTCVGASRDDTLSVARSFAEAGVKQIVALRGDSPTGADFAPHPDGFTSSVDMIEALSKTGQFHIHVGAYPDVHPEAVSHQGDLDWLRRKVDAGAGSAITQFFFEADTFERFRDRVADAGIDIPLIPGLLPIENWAKTLDFARRCGAQVPVWLSEIFERADRDGHEDLLAMSLCSELASDLIDLGVEDLHFYTLNKAELTSGVLTALGYRNEPNFAKVA